MNTGSRRYSIFISSVQKELAEERSTVKDFINHDPLFSRFIRDGFFFEDIPAGDRKPDDIYLDEVARCDIYLAILGNRYGSKNQERKSPTELEFDEATRTHWERLIFLKGSDDKAREPEMAEPLYRIKYVEKAGTGTTDMIADCRKAGLPEPDFEQRGPYFVVTVWRDWLTDEVLADFNLIDRQKKAITLLKAKGKITSGEYREHTGIEARTATRDLNELVKKGVLIRHGEKRGTYYTLRKGNWHLSDI